MTSGNEERRPGRGAFELALVGLALALAVWGLVHALTPRADGDVEASFTRAAEHVKAHAHPGDPVLVRPVWELAGARAFLPLDVRVYQRPVPSLWQGRRHVWVATAHDAEPPAPLRAALALGERREFGPVRVYRFDVRVP
jgi:hypothetical protein